MTTVRTQFQVSRDGERQTITVEQDREGAFTVRLAQDAVELDVQQVGSREYHVLHGQRSLGFLVDGELPRVTVHHAGAAVAVELLDERHEARLAADGGGQRRGADGTVAITAPMPGQVVKRLVEEGEEVSAGQGVIVVEAMKMENELRSTVDGRVRAFKVSEGDNVDAGECLVLIE